MPHISLYSNNFECLFEDKDINWQYFLNFMIVTRYVPLASILLTYYCLFKFTDVISVENWFIFENILLVIKHSLNFFSWRQLCFWKIILKIHINRTKLSKMKCFHIEMSSYSLHLNNIEYAIMYVACKILEQLGRFTHVLGL